MLMIKTTKSVSNSLPKTLRQESCVCDRECSILFDQRKAVTTSWASQTLPGCWKKGKDVFITRVDRRAAEAEQAMEQAYKLIQIGR